MSKGIFYKGYVLFEEIDDISGKYFFNLFWHGQLIDVTRKCVESNEALDKAKKIIDNL